MGLGLGLLFPGTMSFEFLAGLVLAHGYLVVFLAVVLDCAALPIPGELLLLTIADILFYADARAQCRVGGAEAKADCAMTPVAREPHGASHVHDFEPDGRCASGEHIAQVPHLVESSEGLRERGRADAGAAGRHRQGGADVRGGREVGARAE